MAAGTELASAYVSLTISARDVAPQVNKQLGAVEKQADRSGKAAGGKLRSGITGALRGIGPAFAAALGTAAVVAGFKDVIGKASELEQSIGGVKAVFKGDSAEIEAASKAAAKNLGLSRDEYNKLATTLGAGLKNKGVADFAGETQNLITIGGDLAAQFGGSTKDAVDALSSAMRGESDPIEKYGVALNETAVNAKLAEMGVKKSGGAYTEQQKTMARLALITEQTKDAQGAFGREGETAAGRQAKMTAAIDNIKTTIGTGLLPAFSGAVNVVSDFVTGIDQGTGSGGRFKEIIIQIKDGVMGAVDWFKRYSDILVPLGGAVLAIVAAMKVWSAITKAYIAIQTALNVVMSANPIGLVVLAIVGLVAALVLAYKKSETFRAIVDKAWAGIKAAVSSVVNWFRATAWPIMQRAFQWIGDKAKWLWQVIIKPYFTAMWTLWGTVFRFLRDTVWPIARRAFEDIGGKAKWLWSKVIKPSFDSIKTGATRVKDAFVAAKDGIGRAWSGLKGLIEKPIKAAVSFINDKFVKPMNTLLEKVGISFRVPLIGDGGGGGGRSTRGGVQKFATGGVVGGHSPHDRADNIPAMLTAGEYVLPVPAVRRLSSRFGGGFLESLRRGLPGYADGGIVGKVKGGVTDAVNLAKSGIELLRNPGKFLADMASRLLGGIGESPFAKAAAGIARKVASGLVGKVKSFVGDGGDVSGRPGGAMRWQSIWSMIKAVAPESRMTSNYRPGAVTASGFPSKHGMGRAVDLVSGNMMETFRKIRGLRAWTELYYSPAEGQQLLNGRRHIPQGITRRMHYNHIHAAMADGGLVKPLLFDRGGVLPQGTSLVHNATGAPEPLARVDQLGGVQRIEGTLDLGNGLTGVVRGVLHQEAAAARGGSSMAGADL